MEGARKRGARKRLRDEKRVVVNLEPAHRALLRVVAVERYAAGDAAGMGSAVRHLISEEARRRGHKASAA